MTPLEFIARLRRSILFDEGGDTGAPPTGYSYRWEYDDSPCLWKNAELIAFLDDARTEYFRRVGVLSKRSLAVIAGKTAYPLQDALTVERVIDSGGNPLAKISHEDVDWSAFPLRWSSGETLPPAGYYYEDADADSIRIVGAPVASETFSLVVRALPSYAVTWDDRSVEDDGIKPVHYPALLHWAAHLAYLKRDSETMDLAASDRHAALFAQQIAPPLSAETERWRRGTANRPARSLAQFI